MAVVVLALLFAAGCRERPAPTPLTPSTWGGTMRYLGDEYAFTLVITEVDGDGDFRGSLEWTTFGTSSWVKGQANGARLIFVDVDRDVKDVTLTGREMHGTDKNGMATFDARRIDAEARPREVPTLPVLPAMNPAWARRAAVCEGLATASRAGSLGGPCWKMLALSSGDVAVCARLRTADQPACQRGIAAERGETAKCEGDATCVVNAAVHGGGEAACETLREAPVLARCLAGVRRSPAPCEGLSGSAGAECLDHLARVTRDPDACARISGAGDLGPMLRDACLRDVGIALHSAEICGRLELDARRSTLGALAARACYEGLATPTTEGACRRLGTSGLVDGCLLRLVGEGAGGRLCEGLKDETMKAACLRAAALPPTP